MSIVKITGRGGFWLNRRSPSCGFLAIVLMALLWGCQPADPALPQTATPPPPTRIPRIGVDFSTRVPPTPVVIDLPTATPLPPPTVTPTPTPIIYEISEGDTILGIAIQKNTTTDEILQLNPGVRPELLQIGSTLVLPPPATPIFGGAAATPLPVKLTILQTHLYQTAGGRSWIIGELINEGDHWVTQSRLRIGALDSSGTLLGEQAAWTSGPLIPPGETVPFGVLWPGELPDDTTPSAAVGPADALVDPFDPALGRFSLLTVRDTSLVRLETGAAITGELFNPSETTTAVGEVVVTWRGRGDQIIGFATWRSPPISAGTGIDFEIISVPPGGRPIRFDVVVVGITQ